MPAGVSDHADSTARLLVVDEDRTILTLVVTDVTCF